MRFCNVDGCNEKHRAKGFCRKHYYRVKANNGVFKRTKFDKNKIIVLDEIAIMELYNMVGQKVSETIIDTSDIEIVSSHKWYLGKRGYPTSRINGKLICLHKFITGFIQTDHIDGNSLNNRRNNLRESTQQQNLWNKKGNVVGTSKYKGVYFDKRRNKWISQCKRKHCGSFNTEIDAAAAYNLAAIKTYGEYAWINKI